MVQHIIKLTLWIRVTDQVACRTISQEHKRKQGATTTFRDAFFAANSMASIVFYSYWQILLHMLFDYTTVLQTLLVTLVAPVNQTRKEALKTRLTSVTVVQVGKLIPLVVLDEAEEGPLDIGSHLDDELLIPVQGEAGRDEGDVERPTKGRDGVHGLLVVESENCVNSS